MKLSMWMIMNRLAPLMEIRSDIRWEAPPVLNSTRQVYATNCVHIYKEGKTIVCDGEGDKIFLSDMTEQEAFEIIQGVFDYYQDWEEIIMNAVADRNYQLLLNESWRLFQNPLLIQDANYRVLAMSREVDPAEMDPEWQYLQQHGYASLESLMILRNQITPPPTDSEFYRFMPQANQRLLYGGIFFPLNCHGIPSGRITLFEKNRPVNPGDLQLLRILTRHIEPTLAESLPQKPQTENVFYSLLFQKPYHPEELQRQLSYQRWDLEGTWQLAVLLPLDAPRRGHTISLHLLESVLVRELPDTMVIRHEPYLLLLANHNLSEDSFFLSYLQEIAHSNPLHIALSLTTSNVRQISYLYAQAQEALSTGMFRQPDQLIYHFQDYSIEYILANTDTTSRLHACHPGVRSFFSEGKEPGELYETLKTYLDHDRSLGATAAALYTHRNTVLYRIRKCQEILKDDLTSAYHRYYIRLSMHLLEQARTRSLHAR